MLKTPVGRIAHNHLFHGRATPLVDEELCDRVEDGDVFSIVYLDGQPYDEDDLHRCGTCELYFRWEDEVDDGGLCAECRADWAEERLHLRFLRSRYLQGAL